jgi:hypothetical protein
MSRSPGDKFPAFAESLVPMCRPLSSIFCDVKRVEDMVRRLVLGVWILLLGREALLPHLLTIIFYETFSSFVLNNLLCKKAL